MSIEQLQKIVDSCREAVYSTRDSGEFVRSINEFDRVLAGATRNSILARLMEVFVSIKEEANSRLCEIPGAMENGFRIRVEQLYALQKNDVAVVKTVARKALESARPFYSSLYAKSPKRL